MQEDDALRLMRAVERQRRAARALVMDGTIGDAVAREYRDATHEELVALSGLERTATVSRRRSSRSPPS